ncbi:MAG: type II toxin-antitoxin system HicA family toxin [Chloroflexi bacterium]|nr:type II toxin-antitoxin system HicA family toxin [Chloroflexota bacterium]
MSRLPAITGAEVVRALERAGFQVMRQRGSHVFLKHPDGRATVVPVHHGETLGPGILLKIGRDIEISRQELIALLRER